MPKSEDGRFLWRIVYERRAGRSKYTEEEVVEAWTEAAARAHGELTVLGQCLFPALERDLGWYIARIERTGADSYDKFLRAMRKALRKKKEKADVQSSRSRRARGGRSRLAIRAVAVPAGEVQMAGVRCRRGSRSLLESGDVGDPAMKVPYHAFRTSAMTGDLVFFSGKGGVSAAIKRLTRSRWSHVGMVVVNHASDLVALWEATTLSTVRDLDSRRFLRGVQTVALSERVITYDGELGFRALKSRLSQKQIAQLGALRRTLSGRPYEEDLLELLRAAYDGPLGLNTRDLSSLFCSELVAEALQALGLLSRDLPSNEFTPADLAEGPTLAEVYHPMVSLARGGEEDSDV